MLPPYKQLAPPEIFGLLSDPTRVSILEILFADKELCVSGISEKARLSLSATSHQLRKLEFLGIVSKYRYGQEICYCLNKENKLTNQLIKLIKAIK